MPGQVPGGEMPGQQSPGGQNPGQGEMPGTQGEGNQPGTQSQPTWEQQQGGGAAGGQEMPQGGMPPGGAQGGQPGGAETESWESGVPGSGSGNDGWETSNQLPGGNGSRIPPMPSEQGLPPGAGAGAGQNGQPPGGQDGQPPGGQGGDSELDKALEDFDGEILAERAVIQQRSNERAGSGNAQGELPGEQGAVQGTPGEPGGAQQQTAGYVPRGMPSQNNSQKAPPMSTGGSQVPEDIPDARDDDIIARQLREAAMNEPDPELREKLWEEYRRYKGA